MTREDQIKALEKDWAENPRWLDVERGYSAADVVRLRGSVQPEYTWPSAAPRSWGLVHGDAKKGYVNCMGALTGGQAVQQAKAGIEAIYLSGWQVAADGNTSETMYPTSRCTPTIRCRRWCAGSTMRSNARTRSSGRAASARATRVISITSCRSWPMPRPVSVACSTPSN